MFHVKVICPCGAVSERAAWGPPTAWALDCVHVPVYDPATGELQPFAISMTEQGVGPGDGFGADERADAWLASQGPRLVREKLGGRAIPLLSPSPQSLHTPLPCPKCGRVAAKFDL